MDVHFAEGQTAKMSRMLLTHSLRLKQRIREDDFANVIAFNVIDKVCVILTDISKNAHELGENRLTQTVPLEHLHFFFTVLHMNLHWVDMSFLHDVYFVYKLKLGTQSIVHSTLVYMNFMDETLSLLFPSGFADPKEGEEPQLKINRSQIRILLIKIKSLIPDLRERINVTRIYDKMTLEFVEVLKKYSNPVASCLVDSPLKVCAICRQQQMTENVGFAAVNCCRHLYCMPCVKKHLMTRQKCPACKEKIGVTVSSSYMKRPAFKAGPPEKYDLIMNSKGFIARL